MREKLLEILAEPGTGAALTLRNAKGSNGRIDEGELVTEAGRVYPIRGGIPRFVQTDPYAGSFGMQWNKFRTVQIDADTGAGHSRERFDVETGWFEDDLRDKWVLDAGCGAGRFSAIAATRGPNLVSLDLSSAVEATKRTLSKHDNVDVVQGSLLDLPFKKGVFDFAYCIGVVQHTPDPASVVANIVDAVKPGGGFQFSVYARRPWTKLNTKYLIRPLTRRLSHDRLLGVIEKTMPVVFPLTDAAFRVPVLGRVARFAIPVANYPERREFSREQRYAEAVLDTFDMLSPRYDSPMTWREIEKVFRRVGAKEWTFKTRVPIVVRGTR